jgi:1-acyl-sn-glycerol-3-phosphate acyltransferase
MASLAYYVTGLLFKTAVFGEDMSRGFRYRYKFTSAAIRILALNFKVEGKAHEGAALYVSNHRSMLDPFIELNLIEAFIVSKAEVAKYPIIGAGARATGVIFVQRGDHTSRSATKDAIRQTLLDGYSVLIYPEGTTSNLQTTQDFKLGSFKVAFEANIPVVPVAIDYRDPTHKWEDGGLLGFIMHKFSAKRIDTSMSIGTPISAENAVELMQKSKTWIQDELIRMHGEWS